MSFAIIQHFLCIQITVIHHYIAVYGTSWLHGVVPSPLHGEPDTRAPDDFSWRRPHHSRLPRAKRQRTWRRRSTCVCQHWYAFVALNKVSFINLKRNIDNVALRLAVLRVLCSVKCLFFCTGHCVLNFDPIYFAKHFLWSFLNLDFV